MSVHGCSACDERVGLQGSARFCSDSCRNFGNGIAEGHRMEREAIVAWLRDDETSNAIWLDHRQAEALAKLIAAGAHRGEHEKGAGE